MRTVRAPQAAHDLEPLPQRERSWHFDVLRVPLLGRFLRWRWSRTALQIPVALVALVMILHALFGPQLAPKNLGALLTWVHFRGLVVLAILLVGNLFCMACPFMLPRDLARRFYRPRWTWPRWLRNKWLAIALFVAVLFAYELFDLWSRPRWTGWLIVGYFVAAFVTDMLFRRASFCKYVCPIGQFNFLASTLSPFEVAVREPQVCTSCQTKDCIRGRAAEVTADVVPGDNAQRLPIVQRGCELALFQPRKVGNLDCTFCLDCVYACPHENVGILPRIPGETLAVNGARSGLGAIERRTDFAALEIVFVFAALLNAFAMTSPVYACQQWLARQSGIAVEWPILGAVFFVALMVEPAVLLVTAAQATRRLCRHPASVSAILRSFVRGLVPLGFGIWLAHYAFHFFTGLWTVVPVTQAALIEVGLPILGEPRWEWGGFSERAVFPLELGFLTLGLMGSCAVTWRIAQRFSPEQQTAAFAPWAVVCGLVFAAACWILTQPMDMRGTFLGG